MKNILNIKTLYDNNNQLTYVVTKYSDNTVAIKIYKKEYNTNKYMKTLQSNSLLNF